MAALGRVQPEIDRRGAQVLGVSCDSRVTLAAWKKATGITTRLVSDFWPHGAIGASYGAFDERLGINTRSTFVLDVDGIVRETITSEIGRARAVERYLEVLDRMSSRASPA